MNLSQKAYAATKHVTAGSIKGWYDKNYLPGATRNDCTGVYEIPDDTPVPYHEKGLNKITKIPTLMIKLLEAAELTQSVFASMFPGVEEKDFQDTLNGLVEGNKINLVKTEYGVYLRITDEGAVLKGRLLAASKKEKGTLNDILIGTAGSALGGLIVQAINYVFTHPEWAQSIAQFFSTK